MITTTPSYNKDEEQDALFDIMLQSLIKDCVPEFVDPITKKIMSNPVALSSGLVMDSSTYQEN